MPKFTIDKNSPTSGIQEAIDSNSDGNIILLPGKYHIKKSLTIKSGTRIISSNKTILINDTDELFKSFIFVEPYADIENLIVNSNYKSGISIGNSNKNNNINIGYLKVYNTGKEYNNEAMAAVKINGYNTIIDNIDVYLGNIGIDMLNASDIRIKEAQVVACSSGIRISGANNISFNNFSIDSCSYAGLQIDSTENSYFNGTVWNNTFDYKDINSQSSVSIGKYSKENSNIKLDLRIIDTGETAVEIKNSRNIYINSIISNKYKENIKKGFEFGENIDNIYLDGILDNIKTPFSGNLRGKNNIIVNGL